MQGEAYTQGDLDPQLNGFPMLWENNYNTIVNALTTPKTNRTDWGLVRRHGLGVLKLYNRTGLFWAFGNRHQSEHLKVAE